VTLLAYVPANVLAGMDIETVGVIVIIPMMVISGAQIILVREGRSYTNSLSPP
jgi:hypothetical protein